MDILKVIDELKEYLFQTPLKEKIAKIILFGSYAKGVPKKGSDIDILIFTTNGRDLEREILERIYDFMVEKNLPFEVLIDSIDSLYPLRDYFIYNASKNGLEVYSMEKSKIKMEMAKSLHRLAEEYLESAEEILERGRLRIAIDSAYNSAELCAKAFILLKEDDLPGSHGGIVSLFGNIYIKKGEIEKEIGRKLNIALELRNKARYKPNEIFSKEDALFVIDLAKTLLEALSKKL
jgi:uncharacterized protein (UPF0332 family)/predicted nucleotidyltransferase